MKKQLLLSFMTAAFMVSGTVSPYCPVYVHAQETTDNPLSGTPNYTVNYSGTEDASGYLFPESSEFKFQGFSEEYEPWIYQYGVNEIYAKHGYTFQTPEIMELFSQKSWYTPDGSFQESLFSEIEKYNIDFLSQCLTATGKDGGNGIPSGTHAKPSEISISEEGKKIKEDLKNVTLNHSYTTRFSDAAQVTFPKFTFDYPDGWSVTEERADYNGESVILTSENGARVEYSHINTDITGGSMANMSRVEVSPIAESSFIPGYVQATDYSHLGKFTVASLKTTGVLNMQEDSDFTDVDGTIRYAVLPTTEVGVNEGVRLPDIAEFSFKYGANIALIASPPSDTAFTEEEQLEAIAILSSFRTDG